MKKVLFGLFVFAAVSAASCKRCATCTFNDPELGRIEEDFCDRSHAYDNALEQYDDNGWNCSED